MEEEKKDKQRHDNNQKYEKMEHLLIKVLNTYKNTQTLN